MGLATLAWTYLAGFFSRILSTPPALVPRPLVVEEAHKPRAVEHTRSAPAHRKRRVVLGLEEPAPCRLVLRSA